MKTLIHGCYNKTTLTTLRSLGFDYFGYDLRALSPNLIPFNELKNLLQEFRPDEVVLTFENERESTVLSFLDLLKDLGARILPEFRDNREVSWYHILDRPFLWMFHPDGDWRNILQLSQLRGVLLPLTWRKFYENENFLWRLIEERNLQVYLHADTFAQAGLLDQFTDLNLSLDLTREVETSYRNVDQDLLARMQLWRKLNENPSL
jgi:hypothetical protein